MLVARMTLVSVDVGKWSGPLLRLVAWRQKKKWKQRGALGGTICLLVVTITSLMVVQIIIHPKGLEFHPQVSTMKLCPLSFFPHFSGQVFMGFYSPVVPFYETTCHVEGNYRISAHGLRIKCNHWMEKRVCVCWDI